MSNPKPYPWGTCGHQINAEVTEFLVGMGILPAEQEADYKLEIAYRIGYEDAIRNYAVWKNGEQLVGAMQRPIKQVLNEFANKEIPVRY